MGGEQAVRDPALRGGDPHGVISHEAGGGARRAGVTDAVGDRAGEVAGAGALVDGAGVGLVTPRPVRRSRGDSWGCDLWGYDLWGYDLWGYGLCGGELTVEPDATSRGESDGSKDRHRRWKSRERQVRVGPEPAAPTPPMRLR